MSVIMATRGAAIRRPDAYTKLLIRGTGTGQAIKELTGKTITVGGNATISTTQKKFGSTSIYLDGSGDYLQLADTDDWYFGTSDFTLEMWVYHTRLTDSYICYLYQNPGSGASWMWFYYKEGATTYLYFQGSNQNFNVVVSFTLNKWHHIAITRNGSSWRFFVDGGQVGTTKSNSNEVPNAAATLRIGTNYNGGYYLQGYIDEIRVTKGIAKWTSNFTPPTRRL